MTPWLLVWLSVAPAETHWDAPDGCPGREAVEAQARRLMLGPPGDVRYRGRIETTADGYRLDLEVRGHDRVVEAADCGKLGTAAALIIAVEHDPIAVAMAVEPVVEPEPEPELVADGEPEPEAVAEPLPRFPPTRTPERLEPPSTSRLLGTLRAGVGAEVGLLPRVGAAFDLGGGLGQEHWRVELAATTSLPRDIEVRERSGYGARAMLFGGQVRGCWVPGDRLQVPVCVGVEAGGMWARGFGLGVTPQSRVQYWMGAVASAGVDYWLTDRFGLMGRAELDVAIRQPAVRLTGVEGLIRVGAAGARLVLGPVLRFP